MTQTHSFGDWISHYVARLQAAGVMIDDAIIAANLGADIVYMHQCCYGIDSVMPVDYVVEPAPRGLAAAASCAGRRFGSWAPGYQVYPVGLAALFATHVRSYGGLVPDHVARMSIAVHEVRHHVQDREAATLRMFARDRIGGFWTDRQAAIVAAGMREQHQEDEQAMRAAGDAEETIRWKLSGFEFDAAVVERLFIHRAELIDSPEGLAAHIRMDAPYLGR